jgi:tetratricopeptide (TPR) repeat protein
VLATKYKQRRSLTYSYNWIGESYFGMGQRDKGFEYIYKALAITHDLNEPYRRMELYEVLNQLYEKTGDYKESLAAYKRYDTLRDSMAVDKNTRRLNEMQVVYEAAKKDKKIADLNAANAASRRTAWIIGIVAFLFLVMLAMLLVQYFTIRKQNRIISGKNEGLNNALLNIAFIQSHEVRKPLTTILGIINLIKAENYKAEKQVLKMLEKTANDLDDKIKQIVKEAEGN